MEETQLLKGILESCVLSLIARGQTYGYQIMSQLASYHFDHVKDGTLYPILTRLEKKGMIISHIGDSPLGPKRKYFNMTNKGSIYLQQFLTQYHQIINQANALFLNEGDHHEHQHG